MVIIRKANLEDAERIATYLLLAMKEIIFKLIGEADAIKAKEFMLHFVKRVNTQYSFQNCWVAEVEKEVVAAVNIYDGANLNFLRQPVIEYVESYFGKDFQAEDETQAGEFYIDSIGVNPCFQSKGVGTKLLRFLIDDYVNKQGLTLGLLVEEENRAAKRFYLRIGFKSAGKKTLLGKHMEHLQIRG